MPAPPSRYAAAALVAPSYRPSPPSTPRTPTAVCRAATLSLPPSAPPRSCPPCPRWPRRRIAPCTAVAPPRDTQYTRCVRLHCSFGRLRASAERGRSAAAPGVRGAYGGGVAWLTRSCDCPTGGFRSAATHAGSPSRDRACTHGCDDATARTLPSAARVALPHIPRRLYRWCVRAREAAMLCERCSTPQLLSVSVPVRRLRHGVGTARNGNDTCGASESGPPSSARSPVPPVPATCGCRRRTTGLRDGRPWRLRTSRRHTDRVPADHPPCRRARRRAHTLTNPDEWGQCRPSSHAALRRRRRYCRHVRVPRRVVSPAPAAHAEHLWGSGG